METETTNKKNCECQKKENKNTQHDHHKEKNHSCKHQGMEGKIKKLEEEKKELENKVLLAQAELVNYRRRKDEEVSNRLKFANQDLILELLPVLDNFERAIQLDDNNLSDGLSKFLAGFKMMYAHMNEILKQFGVEEIDCLGKEFDPNSMEALMTDNDPEYDDNIVLDVLMKGYRLKDRIIRAAKVKVNQKELEENKGEDKDE